MSANASQPERPSVRSSRPSVQTAAAIVVLVKNKEVRQRCRNSLEQLRATGQPPPAVAPYLEHVVYVGSQADATRKLRAVLSRPGSSSALLLSDVLADADSGAPGSAPEPTKWAADIRKRFGDKLLGMVAIAGCAPRGVPDIDRVVPLVASPKSLCEALDRTAAALDYKSPPERTSPACPIEVRRVRRQHELVEYYRLRYRVYNTLLYLDHKLETRGSGIEADWRDLNSVHVAAFERRGPQRNIVGTARLILSEALDSHPGLVDPRLSQWTMTMAGQDPVLRKRFRAPYPHLLLPVWHSQPVQDRIIEMYERGERHAELSRVTVGRDHRGAGLSRILVRYCLHVARALDVDWLFLECVPLHRVLYEKFGFEQLPGTYNRVVNVDKTVIAMVCQPARVIEQQPGLLPESAKRVVQEQDYLCCCKHRDCYSKEYGRYGTDTCTLRPGRPR